MTINGQHTAGEVSDLLTAKDFTLKAMKNARAASAWADAAAQADWDADFTALMSRYNSAATKARAAVIGAYGLSGGLIPLEDQYQGILHALTRVTGSTQKGDVQDLDARLTAAGSPANYDGMPQPTAVDADLTGFQATDAGIKAGEKAAAKSAPFVGVGMLLGVAAAVTVAAIMLPRPRW